MKSLKKGLIIGLIAILLVSGVFAWSYTARKGVYTVTLDTGKVVTISNITHSGTTISAVVTAKNLTIQDALNIKMIEENITDQLENKHNNYTLNVIVLNTK